MKNNKFPVLDINNQLVNLEDVVNVYDSHNNFVGYGWFEAENDVLFFREDLHHLLPSGMNQNIIENIFDYKFEKV